MAILRETPYPPGSYALAASEDWQELRALLPDQQGFIYGTADNALVFTYDSRASVVTVFFAIVEGAIAGADSHA
jgi:hypothetical protein